MLQNFLNKLIFYYKENYKIISIAGLILIAFILVAFKKCNETMRPPIKPNEDVCLNLHKNYSDYRLDSTLLDLYSNSYSFDDSVKIQVVEFYHSRENQFAWFNNCGMISATSTLHQLIKNYTLDFKTNSSQNTLLDSLINKALEDEKTFLTQWNQVSQLEFLLTANFFKYAPKIYSGSVENPKKLSWFIPRRKKNFIALLDTLIRSSPQTRFEEPLNPYYIQLKKKLIEYKKIEVSGNYTEARFDSLNIKIGDSNIGITIVKKQLFLLGDYTQKDTSVYFTEDVATALRHFQMRMGLEQTGLINKKTLVELNTPISNRIKQILLNLERLRWIPTTLPPNFLLVNIPEFKLHIIENGTPKFNMNIIVGKVMNKTVIFEGKISSIVLNPYWNIPNSIVDKEIKKHIARNANYLSRNNMEVIKTGNTYLYRQKPGDKNALGKIKFLFPNQYSIYLHDAPAKSLFNTSIRAFSHGCIRVADAKKLALYILNKQADWSEIKLNGILATNVETPISIEPTIPVFIAYFTTWVDSSGAIHFRKDIYGLDHRLDLEIFGE